MPSARMIWYINAGASFVLATEMDLEDGSTIRTGTSVPFTYTPIDPSLVYPTILL